MVYSVEDRIKVIEESYSSIMSLHAIKERCFKYKLQITINKKALYEYVNDYTIMAADYKKFRNIKNDFDSSHQDKDLINVVRSLGLMMYLFLCQFKGEKNFITIEHIDGDIDTISYIENKFLPMFFGLFYMYLLINLSKQYNLDLGKAKRYITHKHYFKILTAILYKLVIFEDGLLNSKSIDLLKLHTLFVINQGFFAYMGIDTRNLKNDGSANAYIAKSENQYIFE